MLPQSCLALALSTTWEVNQRMMSLPFSVSSSLYNSAFQISKSSLKGSLWELVHVLAAPFPMQLPTNGLEKQ